jgi:hypothetical protein
LTPCSIIALVLIVSVDTNNPEADAVQLAERDPHYHQDKKWIYHVGLMRIQKKY